MAPLKNCLEARSQPRSVRGTISRRGWILRYLSTNNVPKMGEITFRNFHLFSNLLKTRFTGQNYYIGQSFVKLCSLDALPDLIFERSRKKYTTLMCTKVYSYITINITTHFLYIYLLCRLIRYINKIKCYDIWWSIFLCAMVLLLSPFDE